MKTLFTNSRRKFTWPVMLLVLLQFILKADSVFAQPGACDGITMYAIFNDSIDATKNTNSIIAPVNSTTGVVGTPLMTGGSISLFHRYQTGPNKYYYGSASLALDPLGGRFYANSQMINPTAKDFFAISTVGAGGFNVIATSPGPASGIATTANEPIDLDDYHFVKMATVRIAATNYVFALGVIRDTTLVAANLVNPLIRMTACGTAGCAQASMTLLGYLPSNTPMTSSFHMYNGDMAFDINGNLYYATVAFERIGGVGRYTDARLFKILAANIPAVAGTGTIPMQFVADYNVLDSSAMDGIAFDGGGAMLFTTKHFNGIQGLGTTTQNSQMYRSTLGGTATLLPAFTAPATFSVADLSSCSFPLTTLAQNELQLSGRYINGNSSLAWTVNNNTEVMYYEVQRSSDGNNFSTIARVNTENSNVASATYTYNDPQNGYSPTMYYRVRQILNGGMRFYSPVLTVLFNNKMNLVSKPVPNPFVDNINVGVQLKSAGNISTRLLDQNGRIVYRRNYSGQDGQNKITLDGLLHLSPGIYILEMAVGEEIIREKVIKR